jgi:hypothetical protein
MKLKNKLAAVVPFAHLLGIRAESETDDTDEEKKKDEAKHAKWAKAAETDDERKQKDGESDDDYAKRMEKLDEEDDKKAKGEKSEDDDASADEGSEEAKAARHAERARCAKIIAHGIHNGCAKQAFVFAFDTTLSSAQAIAAMSASKLDGGAKGPGLGQRMAGVSVIKVGADVPESHDPSNPQAAAKAIADSIIASAAKARGEKA